MNFGLQRLCMVVGIPQTVNINTAASSPTDIANRPGFGKVRHIEVDHVWPQEQVTIGKTTITELQ